MPGCEKCGAVFRDNYDLSRHQARIRPCIEKNKNSLILPEQNDTPNKQKDTPNKQKDTVNKQKDIADEQKDTTKECKFCLNTYFNKQSKNRHESICKQRHDPTRLLEIENNIEPAIPDCKTECRYCNKTFSRTALLNKHLTRCNEKDEYRQMLLKQKNNVSRVQNINGENVNVNCNVTNNNNNIVNNLVLNFGEETMEHIELRDIIKILKEAKDEYRPEEFSKIAGEFVCLFDKLLKENPKNKNITIPCLNSMYANVKYSHGWETMPIDKVVHRLIKNTSKRVLEQRQQIEEYDRKNNTIGTVHGSRLRIAPHVFNEVNNMNTNGITDLEPLIRTSLKLNNF